MNLGKHLLFIVHAGGDLFRGCSLQGDIVIRPCLEEHNGGMSHFSSLALISVCFFSSPEEIMNLQYRMILDYTARVERLHLGKHPTKLTVDVANYIQHHMSELITAEKIAEELFLSRPYLSRKFKEETGESLTDFILKEKTEGSQTPPPLFG